ncbi:hypothetical protein [uncultured Nitratireductor sp.]|uniref:hypothetical protein n=1 Tax=uncultured Nitratireductor sp. TaxID=520953 RepID=UPI00261539F1|nr:hypothetical protein [uncultured Nitratireductor sp.]
MHKDIKAEIDALRKAMVPGQPIEEIERAWDHYKRIEAHFENYHSHDKAIMQTVGRLKDGLGWFTRDVREAMPSPYLGFGVELSALRSHLDDRFSEDGWPK